jgi:hypothetical protein
MPAGGEIIELIVYHDGRKMEVKSRGFSIFIEVIPEPGTG